MLVLTKANSKTEYTFTEDKDVVCFLRPLTISERAEVRDLVKHTMDGGVELNINKQHVYITKRCLVGIKGVEGVEFTTDPIGVSSELLDVLPMRLIAEIGNEVYRLSEAQAQEKK
jgi:hypothetical protein